MMVAFLLSSLLPRCVHRLVSPSRYDAQSAGGHLESHLESWPVTPGETNGLKSLKNGDFMILFVFI